MTQRFWLFVMCSLVFLCPLKADWEEEAAKLVVREDSPEEVVGIDSQLEQLDVNISVAFDILKDFSTPEEQKELIAWQDAWLKKRDATSSKEDRLLLFDRHLKVLKNRIDLKEEPILSQILLGVSEMDDQKAIRLLKNCPTLACQAYLAYFETEQLPNESQRKAALGARLVALFSKMDPLGNSITPWGTKVDEINSKGRNELISEDPYVELASLNPHPPYEKRYPAATFPEERVYQLRTSGGRDHAYIHAPLWFILRHPETLSFQGGGNVYVTDVNKERLPDLGLDFEAFWLGCWSEGTIHNDILPHIFHSFEYLYYAPDQLLDPEEKALSTKMTMDSPQLKIWSLEGPWNEREYRKFEADFANAAKILKAYYESKPYLKRYAPFAGRYLNALLRKYYDNRCRIDPDDLKLVRAFDGKIKDLQALKNNLERPEHLDLERTLSYAILKGYGTDVLEWFLQQGANLNGKVYDETPLIKASDRPDILKFLIAKGAALEGKTDFGKTALFYAIQFNNLESVKVLVEAGANLNPVLSEPGDDSEYHRILKIVLGFTPLAYSVRYGSEEMTRYLVEHGASLKDAPLETLKEWTDNLERFKQHMAIIQTELERLDANVEVAFTILKEFSTPAEQKELLAWQNAWVEKYDAASSKEEKVALSEKRLRALKNLIRTRERPILSQILVGIPEIDDQKAIRLLKNCPTLACQAYLAYFETEQLPNEDQRKAALGARLVALFSKLDPLGNNKIDPKDPYVELCSLNQAILPEDKHKLQGDPGLTISNFIEAPLWFVLRHPNILNYVDGFGGYPIGPLNLDEEELPLVGLDAGRLHLGHWQGGKMYKYYVPYYSRGWTYLYYTPDQLLDPDEKPLSTEVTLNNPALKIWSLEGPWNEREYSKFKADFANAARELQEYYESKPYLKKYAPFAGAYLNALVGRFYSLRPYFFENEKRRDENTLKIFGEKGRSLTALKKDVASLPMIEWEPNLAFSYAILNGYGTDVLEWLLHQGANLKEKVYDETPLIKASDRPDILKFLIAKGADLEGKTGFGKTALFYAVQFNNLESVKVLVEAGANLNPGLSEDTYDWEYFALEKVLGFTPLAYSVRYGSDEMTRYLAEHGASLKDASLETLEAWTDNSERFKQHMVIIESASPSK